MIISAQFKSYFSTNKKNNLNLRYKTLITEVALGALFFLVGISTLAIITVSRPEAFKYLVTFGGVLTVGSALLCTIELVATTFFSLKGSSLSKTQQQATHCTYEDKSPVALHCVLGRENCDSFKNLHSLYPEIQVFASSEKYNQIAFSVFCLVKFYFVDNSTIQISSFFESCLRSVDDVNFMAKALFAYNPQVEPEHNRTLCQSEPALNKSFEEIYQIYFSLKEFEQGETLPVQLLGIAKCLKKGEYALIKKALFFSFLLLIQEEYLEGDFNKVFHAVNSRFSSLSPIFNLIEEEATKDLSGVDTHFIAETLYYKYLNVTAQKCNVDFPFNAKVNATVIVNFTLVRLLHLLGVESNEKRRGIQHLFNQFCSSHEELYVILLETLWNKGYGENENNFLVQGMSDLLQFFYKNDCLHDGFILLADLIKRARDGLSDKGWDHSYFILDIKPVVSYIKKQMEKEIMNVAKKCVIFKKECYLEMQILE